MRQLSSRVRIGRGAEEVRVMKQSIYSDALDWAVWSDDELGEVVAMIAPMRVPTELEVRRLAEVFVEFERRAHDRCGSDYDCHGGDYACFFGRRGVDGDALYRQVAK